MDEYKKYTRHEMFEKLKRDRDTKDRPEDKLKNWVNNTIMKIEKHYNINPIAKIKLEGRSEVERPMYEYSSSDWWIIYDELVKVYDGIVNKFISTDEMKQELKKRGIELVNPSARISKIRKELNIEPVKTGKPNWFKSNEANQIIERIEQTYRNTIITTDEEDEQQAIEIIERIDTENIEYKAKIVELKLRIDELEKSRTNLVESNTKLIKENSSLKAELKVAVEENKKLAQNRDKKSNRLIDRILILGKRKYEQSNING